MIDLELLRKDPQHVAAGAAAKGVTVDVKAIQTLDAEVRSLQQQADALRADKRTRGKGIPGRTGAAKTALLTELKTIDGKLEALTDRLDTARTARDAALREIPNLPDPRVPVSLDEAENHVLRTWGTKPKLTDPKPHELLGAELGILDLERAVKLSGTRFAVLKGPGAELELALVRLAVHRLAQEGFELVMPPALIKAEHMRAMGYLDGGGESETYHLKEDDLYLIGTAEQALGPLHAGETFAPERLPVRLAGYSPSFRREAGSYGKDTKGLIRVHQFDKVEMFAFTAAEDSDAEHQRFLELEEELVRALELPYRVVEIVTGGLGYPAARKFDIEVWFPSQRQYRETHSTSNTTDYQTRRLGVHVRRSGGSVLAHAVNGTAFAIGRTVAALLENGQQPDGSVKLPKALRPYLGYDRIRPRK